MKAIIFFLSTLWTISTFAQQDIQMTNFDYFSAFFNPASITKTKHICGDIIGRNQWSGLNGRPNTGYVNACYNFSDLVWTNLIFTKDVIGFQNSNLLKIGVAKSFKIVQSTTISFGINLNYSQNNWTSNFITPDTPVPYDHSIPDQDLSTGNFDMDAGIYVKSNNVSFGISTTHITEPSITRNNFNFQHKRHYFVLCGYDLNIRSGNLENFLLAKSDAASTQIDLKSNFWHHTGWMAGLGYRVSDAIMPMIGYQKTSGRITARFIYSYDITLSRLNKYSSGTHELCVKICVSPEKFLERYTHPRHLGTWK